MALVVIQIYDRPDGSAGVELRTEPPITNHVQLFTVAQQLGAKALNAIHAELHTEDSGIKLMGADEMPLN
jgi:hypothetical protein